MSDLKDEARRRFDLMERLTAPKFSSGADLNGKSKVLEMVTEQDDRDYKRRKMLLHIIRVRECESSGLLHMDFDYDENGEPIPEL